MHLLPLLTMAIVQGSMNDPQKLARAQQNLAYEAEIAAALPAHANLLRPVAIIHDDPHQQHVDGLVYPLMEGGDVFDTLR